MTCSGPQRFPRERSSRPCSGKDPLIKRTFRPPNYETPVSDLAGLFTDNRKFFVRYHLLSIPEIDTAKWRLRVGGEAVDKPIVLDPGADLRSFAEALGCLRERVLESL